MKFRLPAALILDVEKSLTTDPLVRETLAWFRARGTAIVAVSQTPVDVTGARLSQLGFDGLIDMLYAPPASEPPSVDPAPPLESTIARPLVGHVTSPPRALRVILADLDVLPEEAVYVGGRLERDLGLSIVESLAELRARYDDDARGEPRAKGAARG